jgi:serine-type D-Ala-D-Ala carboxypeptidase/endopeptidase
MISRRILVGGLMAAAAPAWAGERPVKETIEQAVETFLANCPQSVGLSLGICLSGQTWRFNYGHVAPGAKAAPTSRTLYPIASITKTFTGTLLAMAQLEERLRLDDDIRNYIDGDYPNLAFDGHPIRICDLVDHRSGLPFMLPDRPDMQPNYKGGGSLTARIIEIWKTYTRAEFYADLHKVTLTSIPGQNFQYSNAAAMLAGYILERLYGQPYETLVKTKITAPLGMTDTTITLSPSQAKRSVKGYDTAGVAMPDNPDAIQAAGALKSTIDDMLKYTAWQVTENDPAVRLSHKSYTGEGAYQGGLNWQMWNDSGRRVIWQSGNIEGFHSYCVAEPELKLGLVALFNQADQDSNPAHNALVNAILKGVDPAAIPLP